MALLNETYLRNLGNSKIQKNYRYNSYSKESVKKSLLNESYRNFNETDRYDIFLSHSYLDKEIIIGIKTELENFGFSVYVDWIEDSHLNRRDVTPENVLLIKKRMKTSKCLLLATSNNSSDSKWMPWELGFMDGYREKVAIFPISTSNSYSFKGTEYLSIYPYIDKAELTNTTNEVLWVNDQYNGKKYIQLVDWLKGHQLKIHN